MERAAFVARITTIVLSFGYMALLLPQAAGIEAEHFSNGWLLGAAIVALSWIPLIAYHRYFKQKKSPFHLVLSFAPLFFFAAYFGALFAAAG